MSEKIKRNAEAASIDQHSGRQVKRRRRKEAKSSVIHENQIVERTAAEGGQAQPTDNSPDHRGDPSHETHILVSSGVEATKSPKLKESKSSIARGDAVRRKSSSPSKSSSALLPSSGQTIQKDKSSVKKSRKDEASGAGVPSQDLVPPSASDGDQMVAHKFKQKKHKNNKERKTQQWTLSNPIGGTFLDMDPILTPDNQHLILLTKHDIQVYSTTTSLLVRSIAGGERLEFRACALSVSDPRYIFVGTMSGSLLKFDWTNGRKSLQWKIPKGVSQIVSAGIHDQFEDLVAVKTQTSGPSSLLQLSVGNQAHQVNHKTLLEADSLHPHVYVSHDQSTLIACSRDRIHVGYSLEAGGKDLVAKNYSWKSMLCKGRIISFNTRLSERQTKKNKIQKIDIVVGLQNGVMTIYNDILGRLYGANHGNNQVNDLGRRLHWHRTAVRTVKWSRDGNYLVSGGDETVLVIWQLDTNRKQFLPHLSTSILNITISQSGAHYAMRLGDNSVMVLSTADLAPSTNITGFLVSNDETHLNSVLVHPGAPHKLLSAVSARSLGSRATGELTHLQVYDLDARMQLSRQALTRNFTSAVNVDPSGQPLHEPNVTQFCATSDGVWLATVDEWAPNTTDSSSMYLQNEARPTALETTLRIWAWKPDEDSWTPNTRVDEPHQGGVAVVAMATNPVKPEIATIGQDGRLKIWSPKIRVRNGLAIKDAEGNILYTWSCSRTAQIENIDQTSSTATPIGALAYSADGSVIAVGWNVQSHQGAVHLIDSNSGEVVISQPGLITGNQVQLLFCGRYVVVLSDAVMVFDTILLQVTSAIALDPQFTSSGHGPARALAVSSLTNTIAVGVTSSEGSNRKSQVSIFAIENAVLSLSHETTFSGIIRAVLADDPRMGFVIVDSEAGVRRLSPPGHTVLSTSNLIRTTDITSSAVDLHKGVDTVFGAQTGGTDAVESRKLLLQNQEESHVSSLDELFNTSSSGTLPGVHDLFDRVARAVSHVHIAA